MTGRLYYTDPYCSDFSAILQEILTWEGRPGVVLDRTAFYPTSGGQSADVGTLDNTAVVDVVVRERDGAVIHVLGSAWPGGGAGSQVRGVVEWSRRFDHMQQHTGQHILSAAFEELAGADTVGFHVGAEASTIDIAAARLDREVVARVEDLANQVTWQDRDVRTRFVGPNEVAALHLRRPPAVEGIVRIVEIAARAKDSSGPFDVNPCGGTHVSRTGEIGMIKTVGLEYRGNETRIEFLCGGRALRDYAVKNSIVQRLSATLTVGYWELDEAIDRLQGEGKRLRRDLRQLRDRQMEMEATELAGDAADNGSYRVLWRVWEQREPAELRRLAQELVRHSRLLALLVAVGDRTHLCFARAEGVEVDVSVLLQKACERLDGKGGGRPHLAQGSAGVIHSSQVEAVISDLVSDLDPLLPTEPYE